MLVIFILILIVFCWRVCFNWWWKGRLRIRIFSVLVRKCLFVCWIFMVSRSWFDLVGVDWI